jgi:hypothetical protein
MRQFTSNSSPGRVKAKSIFSAFKNAANEHAGCSDGEQGVIPK